MVVISKCLNSIRPSPTLAMVKRIVELKKAGIDVISLAAGEPDFDTANNIKEAAVKAIYDGVTKYTNVDGMLPLKQAIQNKFKRENNIEYDVEEIIVSNGGKQVIYNAFMSSLNEGDEVIIPAPYWVSYPDIVSLSGGVPVFANCGIENNFKLSPEILARLITPKTKWLIINSPSNPTGSAYSCMELETIAEVLRKYPLVNIMSDDIYEHITFDNFAFHTLAQVAPDLKQRILTVNGVSKAYSMTGWRIGYGAGSKTLIKAMSIIQSQSTSNPCSISQMAAVEALNGSQDFIKYNAVNFQKKRDLALSILGRIKYFECYKPEGAFYLFVKCDKMLGCKTPTGVVLKNSNSVGEYLLDRARVAVVPGIAFGLEGYFRISYATSIEELEEACLRIERACSDII